MKYLYTLIFILSCLVAGAQENKWTLSQCMLYAVENSPRINRQQSQNKIYSQNYKEAIGKLLPSVNANTNANFNFGRGLDSETNTYTDVSSFSNSYNLYSSLTLFDGLSGIMKVRLQKANQLMGKQQLQEVNDLVAYETMEAYFDVLYFKELVVFAEQQLKESTANHQQAKRMEELGVKGLPDVVEMAAKEAADNYELTRQRNILQIGIIRLKEKMNFPLDEKLDIEDALFVDLIDKLRESAFEIYEQSKLFIPKATIAQSAVEVQKLNYQSAKGSLFPSISMDAGISTNFSRLMDGSEYLPFKDQFKNKRGHYVGFTLSIPVFNGFSRVAQVKRGKAQIEIAEAEQSETLRILYSEIEQAVTDVNGLADEYYQAKTQVDAMALAHQVNQRKYNEGLVSAIDLNTSANRLLKAKAEELNVKLRFRLKNKLVNYYKGEPFIVVN